MKQKIIAQFEIDFTLHNGPWKEIDDVHEMIA